MNQKFRVTHIDFDFTNDDLDDWNDSNCVSEEYKKSLEMSVKSKCYECDEEELVDLISDETGWCVNAIDYELC